jgi:hypothetical protein
MAQVCAPTTPDCSSYIIFFILCFVVGIFVYKTVKVIIMVTFKLLLLEKELRCPYISALSLAQMSKTTDNWFASWIASTHGRIQRPWQDSNP